MTQKPLSNEERELTQEEFDEAKEMAMFIRGSFKWHMALKYMRFLLIIEGVIWACMDIVRRKRMNVAAKINKNYQNRQ